MKLSPLVLLANFCPFSIRRVSRRKRARAVPVGFLEICSINHERAWKDSNLQHPASETYTPANGCAYPLSYGRFWYVGIVCHSS